MNIEDIEQSYLPLVKRFLPDLISKTEEIGYQIDLFFAENEFRGVTNLRLKQEGEILSETLYDAVRLESKSKYQEEDLYLPIEGVHIFFGFDYDKKL